MLNGLFLAAGTATPVIAFVLTVWILAGGLMARKRDLGLGAAALVGLGVSLYLGFQHHEAAGSSICSVDELFNCDTVNRSVYSELGGIPIAFLGSGFYGGVFLLLLARVRKGAAALPHAGHLILVGAALGLLYSLFLAWASFTLGAWCLFCICLYGINGLLFLGGSLEVAGSGVGAWAGVKATASAADDKSLPTFIWGGALVFILSMGAYRSGSTPEVDADGRETTSSLASLFHGTEGPLDLDGTEPRLGPDGAPYTLVEFADFECPHCGQVFPELHDLVEQAGDIQLRFKHYPISDICNDAVEFPGHEMACGAAAAADCAGVQGRFWEMSGLMFKNQSYLSPKDLSFIAGQVGLDVAAFDACMASPGAMAGVKMDIAHARKVGVHGTPTMLLGGVKDGEWLLVRGGTEAVARLVAAHKAGTPMPATPGHEEH